MNGKACDGKAFCDGPTWDAVLPGLGLTMSELYDRRDAIVHLETAAAFENAKYYQVPCLPARS